MCLLDCILHLAMLAREDETNPIACATREQPNPFPLYLAPSPCVLQGEWTKQENEQVRDLSLRLVDEPLVVLIKLADRLHNMRTVYALRPDRQAAVATETRDMWCGIADRLGMVALKARPFRIVQH